MNVLCVHSRMRLLVGGCTRRFAVSCILVSVCKFQSCIGYFSSISSSLSGATANTWEDILKPRLGNISESKATLLNRGIGLLQHSTYDMVCIIYLCHVCMLINTIVNNYSGADLRLLKCNKNQQ